MKTLLQKKNHNDTIDLHGEKAKNGGQIRGRNFHFPILKQTDHVGCLFIGILGRRIQIYCFNEDSRSSEVTFSHLTSKKEVKTEVNL